MFYSFHLRSFALLLHPRKVCITIEVGVMNECTGAMSIPRWEEMNIWSPPLSLHENLAEDWWNYTYSNISQRRGWSTRCVITSLFGSNKSIEDVFWPISRGRFSTTSGHSLSTGCVRHRQFQLSDISPSSKYNPELRPNFNKDLLAWLRARAHTHTQTHTPHTQTHTHTHTHTHTEKLTLSQPDIQHFPFMCF